MNGQILAHRWPRSAAAQPEWADRPVRERLAVIAPLRRHLAADCEALAASAARPNMSAADILVAEVMPLLAACRFLEKQAARLLQPRRPPGRRPLWLFGDNLLVRRVPFGVVLILAPRQLPAAAAGDPGGAGADRGNGVMVKPAPGWAAPMQLLAGCLVAPGCRRVCFWSCRTAMQAGAQAWRPVPTKSC